MKVRYFYENHPESVKNKKISRKFTIKARLRDK